MKLVFSNLILVLLVGCHSVEARPNYSGYDGGDGVVGGYDGYGSNKDVSLSDVQTPGERVLGMQYGRHKRTYLSIWDNNFPSIREKRGKIKLSRAEKNARSDARKEEEAERGREAISHRHVKYSDKGTPMDAAEAIRYTNSKRTGTSVDKYGNVIAKNTLWHDPTVTAEGRSTSVHRVTGDAWEVTAQDGVYNAARPLGPKTALISNINKHLHI